MSVEIVVSILSVMIAVVSTIIAGIAIGQNGRILKKKLNLQHYEDMKGWFTDIVYQMKALYIKYPDNTNKKELKDMLVEFSASIDLGRLYFSNQVSGEYKINKPEIFRGRRPIILDLIVLYYDIFEKGLQEENAELVWSLQRAFISEMIIFLKKNWNSQDFVSYDYIDPEDIIDIKNINSEKFREMFMTNDIVQAIKDARLKVEDLSKKTKISSKSKSAIRLGKRNQQNK